LSGLGSWPDECATRPKEVFSGHRKKLQMVPQRLLLGSTAMAAVLLAVDVAYAATVSPGGALDVTITGFNRFRAHGGDLDNARLDNNVSSGLDFSNDVEAHVVARAKDDATGIEYGGTIEFEADTNSTFNTDETWLFMRGGFGEFRFGDEDGPADNSKIGGFTIAAGTGGIDGAIVDAIAAGVVGPNNSGDNTKIRYYTPSFGGFELGVSYTPNPEGGSNVASKNQNPQDFVEGALTWGGSFGGVDILASVVGGVCRIEDQSEDTCRTVMGGAAITLWGFKLGAGYGSEHIGRGDRDWFNAGIGASLGPVNLSVTYGQADPSSGKASGSGDIDGGDTQFVNGNTVDEPRNIVLSADIGLMPGLVLAGDVGWFDNDVKDKAPDGSDGDTDDDGVQAVARLGLAF
jgi:predicted porin